ncbi:helix-turn-helix transcriptional regulator [bacterium]|nr:helix-turn-helix transcriptional regulator [bacterium]
MSRAKLLGKNIKKYRELRGLMQNELAERVDLSREYIADIERGLKNISLKKLYIIVDVLNIKCSDLVNFN